MPVPSAHSLVIALGSVLGVFSLAMTGTLEQQAPTAGSTVTSPEPGTGSAEHTGTPQVIAHRGASGHAPENTLAAVDAAAAEGARWVETDVQRTRDGELVLLHDTHLRRTTDAQEVFPDREPWDVAGFTLEEISRLDAGSWFDARFAGEPVPTLEQALDRLTANRQRLLLEIKAPERYPGIEEEVLTVLEKQGWLEPSRLDEDLVIQSFHADSVRTVRELDPRVVTGFLGNPAVPELPAYAAFADRINPRYTTVTEAYVAEVQALKGAGGKPLEVLTWTVNDPGTAVRMAELGVDGIITDYPGRILEALRTR
ncbi:glycerophosphodiester phosphodiesterase family protein [Streptomyces sp. ACA25]|uniref:glycerophosphodiester phosphodiesterase n=1 Tax=Streptomyces sp. ACA25 TaxID=3022596 RepID=UPI0023080564|nr:glycerophosphodiester phosphodiesterase family protein [Streptomyces sp. ACA25]MDB1088515.1 glycerophosphodiester phosphodiesterase family protein [Streptomyces sp. ACA25]